MSDPTNLAQFQTRVLQDAISHGEANYWMSRAATFEWARPRPGDFNGRATPAQVRERDARLARTAEMCRQRASLSRDPMQEVA